MPVPPISVSTQTPSHDGYDMTKDPIAIFSFILLIMNIIAAVLLLAYTTRASSDELWELVHRRDKRDELSATQQGADDTIPLMPVKCKRDHKLAALPPLDTGKAVRFSDVVGVQAVPSSSRWFEQWFGKPDMEIDAWDKKRQQWIEQKRRAGLLDGIS